MSGSRRDSHVTPEAAETFVPRESAGGCPYVASGRAPWASWEVYEYECYTADLFHILEINVLVEEKLTINQEISFTICKLLKA